MNNTLFIYERIVDGKIEVTDLQDAKSYSGNKHWRHLATVEPKSFLQNILAENKAVVQAYITS